MCRGWVLRLIITDVEHIGRPQVSWGRSHGRSCVGRSISDACDPEAVVDGPPWIGNGLGDVLGARGVANPGEVEEVGEGDTDGRPDFECR